MACVVQPAPSLRLNPQAESFVSSRSGSEASSPARCSSPEAPDRGTAEARVDPQSASHQVSRAQQLHGRPTHAARSECMASQSATLCRSCGPESTGLLSAAACRPRPADYGRRTNGALCGSPCTRLPRRCSSCGACRWHGSAVHHPRPRPAPRPVQAQLQRQPARAQRQPPAAGNAAPRQARHYSQPPLMSTCGCTAAALGLHPAATAPPPPGMILA